MTLLGASALALGILSGGVQAKTVHYEINGKKYSYSTNNSAQAAEARKRIQAAKAFEAAKAKADAEKSKYPLVGAFGSKTQREAKEAEEKLQQLLSEKGTTDKNKDVAEENRPSAKRSEGRPGKRRSGEIKEASAVETSRQTAALTPEPASAVKAPVAPVVVATPVVAEPATVQSRTKKVKSVSFDVETGIKTTFMIDGSVEEEPFDSSALAQLAPEQSDANSLTAFVKQLRRVSPEESTGSIVTKTAQPAPEAQSPAN